MTLIGSVIMRKNFTTLAIILLMVIPLVGQGGQLEQNIAKHDGSYTKKNGLTVIAEKPLLIDDHLVFRFWTKNNQYWITGNQDGHLKWGICGMGKCVGYSSGFLRTAENDKLKQKGYEALRFRSYPMGAYKPSEEKGIIVPVALSSDVLKGNRVKIASTFSGGGKSHLPFILVTDEFQQPVATYEVSAMYEKKSDEWEAVSVELLER